MTNLFTIDIDGVLTSEDYAPGRPWKAPWEEKLRPGIFWVLDHLREYCGLEAFALTARDPSMEPDTTEWLEHTGLRDLLVGSAHVPALEKSRWSQTFGAIAHIDDHPKMLLPYFATGVSEICLPIHFEPRGRAASLIPEVVSNPFEMMGRLIRLHDEVRRGHWPRR